MKKILSLCLLLALAPFALMAQDAAVVVDRVDFNSLREDRVQMEIELSCRGNPNPDARDSRFVENITVRAYLAYERDGGERSFDYYMGEVQIIVMEQGDDNNVYFYMPGLIVERDDLDTDPDFFYVEVAIDGETQKPQTAAMSSNIPNLEILNSFVSRAESEGSVNAHILTPIYLMAGGDLGRVSNLPAFLRREPRE